MRIVLQEKLKIENCLEQISYVIINPSPNPQVVILAIDKPHLSIIRKTLLDIFRLRTCDARPVNIGNY